MKIHPKIFLAAIYLYYVAIHLLFPDQLLAILNHTLPFSESYFPSASGFGFIYLLPIFLGYYVSSITKKLEIKKNIYFVNLSLFAGILYFFPFLLRIDFFIEQSWFTALTPVYSLMLFPILFLLGTLPSMFGLIERAPEELIAIPKLRRLDYIIAVVLGLIVFSINFIPFVHTDFLIGSDVYYHAPMVNEIAKNHGIISSPYFLEGKNYYYSVVYYIVAFVSQISHLSIESIWMVYPAICAGIFFTFFYLFSRKITSSPFYALLACILVIPTRQLTWGDPSVRNASYVFFAIFLYSFLSYILEKKKVHMFLSAVSLVLTLGSHPEIAIHTVGILLVYWLLVKFNILGYLKDILTSIEKIKFEHRAYIPGFDSYKGFVAMISLYVLALASGISLILRNYSVEQILIFNDIPLSLFNPIGVISFIAFITFPLGLLYLLNSRNKAHLFLLAISSLGLSIVFFLSHQWLFYHRYFVETAYLAFAVSATFVLKNVFVSVNDRYRSILLFVIIVLLGLSYFPKYIFIKQYIANNESYLQNQINNFSLIKENTPENAVIVVNPDNFLNRFIPFYAERYIFSARYEVSKEQQWGILGICNGSPYAKDCEMRNDLNYNLFEFPSSKSLEDMRGHYRIDFLLLSKAGGESEKFLYSDLGLGWPVAENEDYYLFGIK